MENQMENNMEHEMETTIYVGCTAKEFDVGGSERSQLPFGGPQIRLPYFWGESTHLWKLPY